MSLFTSQSLFRKSNTPKGLLLVTDTTLLILSFFPGALKHQPSPRLSAHRFRFFSRPKNSILTFSPCRCSSSRRAPNDGANNVNALQRLHATLSLSHRLTSQNPPVRHSLYEVDLSLLRVRHLPVVRQRAQLLVLLRLGQRHFRGLSVFFGRLGRGLRRQALRGRVPRGVCALVLMFAGL